MLLCIVIIICSTLFKKINKFKFFFAMLVHIAHAYNVQTNEFVQIRPLIFITKPAFVAAGWSLESCVCICQGEWRTSTYGSRVTVKRINQAFLLAMSVFCV